MLIIWASQQWRNLIAHADALLLEGDESGYLLLEGDESGYLLLEGTY